MHIILGWNVNESSMNQLLFTQKILDARSFSAVSKMINFYIFILISLYLVCHFNCDNLESHISGVTGLESFIFI